MLSDYQESAIMQRIPNRFKPNPKKKEAWRLRLLLGKKGLPTAEQIEHFGTLLMKGDPIDEELADWAQDIGFMQARVLLDKALDEGIEQVPEAPDFLKTLFSQIDTEPAWLDRELIELGQQAICRTGIVGTLIMRDVALMGGYGNSAINKPLVFTGSLSNSASRRTSETRAFAVDATRPGALGRLGKGFKTTIRVRFLHAVLRRRIRSHPDWRDDEWGVPINQGDMLATNLAFSVVYLSGMRALGFRYRQREREGIIHLWRYLGYLMGIDEDILATNEKEGLRIIYTLLISQPEADEDTRTLARALMNEPYEIMGNGRFAKLKAEFQVRVHNGISHFFLGSVPYRNLGLPENRRWTWIPLLIFPVVTATETLRQLMPYGNQVFAKLGVAWRDNWIKRTLKNQTAAYKPVETLARDQNKAA
jgi:hypothetical protein